MNIHDLLPAIIIVVVIVLVGAFSGQILSSIQSGQCTTGGWNATAQACVGAGGVVANTSTVASNVTGYGLTTLINLEAQMPNVGLILVVAVIIGILIGSFIVYQSKKSE